MIVGIITSPVGVPDFEQGLAFYRDLLGLKWCRKVLGTGDFPLADKAVGLNETAARMAMLKAPNAFIELWEYKNPEPADHRQRPATTAIRTFACRWTAFRKCTIGFAPLECASPAAGGFWRHLRHLR